MRNLPEPNFEHLETFKASTARFRDKGIRDRAEKAQSDIDRHGRVYLSRARNRSLASIAEKPHVDPLSNEDLKKIYERGLLRRRSAARKVYEGIKIGASRICPICNHRTVAHLDHYLPKSKYGAFAVHPQNLVPSCYECNFTKGAIAGADYRKLPLHPYFDQVPTSKWLICDIIMGSSPFGQFRIDAHDGDAEIKEKLSNHFGLFNLGRLYSIESAAELARNRYLHGQIGKAGKEVLRSYFATKARSMRKFDGNSWRSALYDACSNDDNLLSELAS